MNIPIQELLVCISLSEVTGLIMHSKVKAVAGGVTFAHWLKIRAFVIIVAETYPRDTC